MERYIQISLADVFQMIMNEDFKDVYVKHNGEIKKATDFNYKFQDFKRQTWFKREVIE